MATTTVEGTVNRIHGKGTGFSIVEEWESRGSGGKRYWAVFPKQADPVAVGDRVRATGLLGTKVSEHDSRYVDHSIGNADVVRGSGVVADGTEGSTQAPADAWNLGGSGHAVQAQDAGYTAEETFATQPPADVWPEPAQYDEQVPF